MGLETIAILGLSAMKADSAVRQSQSQANAAIDQANIDAKNKAGQVTQRTSSAQSSFLNSGLTLEGTPMASIKGMFNSGIQDVNQITTNADRQAKNILSKGRTQALSALAEGVAGASFGSGGLFEGSGTLGSQGVVSRTIEFGSPNVQGPIQGFGGFGG